MRETKNDMLTTLRQQTAMLTIKCLRAGANPEEILRAVGEGIDQAVKVAPIQMGRPVLVNGGKNA
jgi:alkylhydroperoxidase/carboxymuconolactone decarboxylase family protein YurZ